MSGISIMWQGDNLEQIKRALLRLDLFAEPGDDKSLVITDALSGGNAVVRLGDSIEFRANAIGVRRPKEPGRPEIFVWKGDNLEEMTKVATEFGLRLAVDGADLKLIDERNQFVRVRRGDQLEKRPGKKLFLSRAGADHRV